MRDVSLPEQGPYGGRGHQGRRRSFNIETQKPAASRRGSVPCAFDNEEVPEGFKRKYFVKYGKDVIEVLVDPEGLCVALKKELEKKTGIKVSEQRFFYNGIKKPFDDNQTLRYYGIHGGGFFTLVREPEVESHSRRRATIAGESQLQVKKRAPKRNSEAGAMTREAEAAELERLAREAEARKCEQEELERQASALEREAARMKAEEVARRAKEAEVRRRAAEEAARQRELERLEQERLENERRAAEEREAARIKAEEERKAKEAARKRAEEKARRKELERLEREQKEREAEEARQRELERKALEDARKKAAEEARKKAEEEARRAKEAEARRRAEEEARRKELEREAEEARQRELERKALEDARKKAEEEARRKAEEARKKAEEERLAREKAEREKYNPTPMDMSTFRCWYQLGDTIPYYIRINGWEKVGELKQHIFETRCGRNCAYLDDVQDGSELKLFPPGSDASIGKELAPDETIPSHTSMDEPLILVK